jgi:hypothetical protein
MLQAKEYERRLEILNHEQSRLGADRERYLPRENFDLFKSDAVNRQELAFKEVNSWRKTVDEFMALSAGRDKGLSIAWVVAIGIGGFVMTVLGVFLAKWVH